LIKQNSILTINEDEIPYAPVDFGQREFVRAFILQTTQQAFTSKKQKFSHQVQSHHAKGVGYCGTTM